MFSIKQQTKKDDMNKRTIEPADALPSYDVKDLVIFHPEGADREMVCRVAGHDRTGPELIYRLVDPLYNEEHLALFSDLKPHVDSILDEFADGCLNDLDADSLDLGGYDPVIDDMVSMMDGH